MGVLALLFVLVPALELYLLIQVGMQIGAASTFLLILATGVVGAALAKRAGLGVLRQIQTDTAAGRLPAGALLEGAIVLVAGALLLTPGILTDIVGFLSLMPPVRAELRKAIVRRLERAGETGQVRVMHVPGGPPGYPAYGNPTGPRRRDAGFGPVIDVTPDGTDRPDERR